ncbi:MAG TPA: sigma-70 family RNA polymerase sigma factor [Gaiellaceae bacterium]
MATVAPEPAVQARDQAFERLYQRYAADVYRYSLALLRNPTDAEDVTQTTFMNAYRAFKRGDEIQKPHNWLIKIAHNVARSRYAHASRRVQELPLEDHIEQLAVPEDDKPNLDTVLRALGQLPFNQRAALVMRELEGRAYAEIADTLGVSVSAVETLIFRARKSLRVKTSSLRVLTGVPLPGSLASLFQGGGTVAGSGAIVGAGFVGKALVALVVGAVATGVGGDRSGPAGAAETNGGGSVASTRADAAGLVAAQLKRDRSGAKHLVVRGRAGSQGARLGDPAGAALADGAAAVASSSERRGDATSSAGDISSLANGAAPSSQGAVRAIPAAPVGTLPQAPAQVVTNAAQNVVNTVTTAVSSATSGIPPNVPAIPPVQPPAVTQVPPVQAPSVPPVQPPPLPPAPPLPRLP